MALFDTTWYISSAHWTSVTAWAAGASIAAGTLRRQNATPTVGQERVFVALNAGTTHGSTEPTWVVTRGAKTTDNDITWQEITGQPSVSNDLTNTTVWTTVKSLAVTLGQVVKNVAATYYFICSTAGTSGAGEPSWNTTVGVTTTDNTVTWTCIGAAGAWANWAGPHARMQNAFATNWGVQGNNFWVGSDNAESYTGSAYTLTFPGSSATTESAVICVDVGGSVPPVSADIKTTPTATLETTGGYALTITGANYNYISGFNFFAGSGATNATLIVNHAYARFEHCHLGKRGTTAISSAINISAATALIHFIDCSCEFGAAGDQLSVRNVLWERSTTFITGAIIPTNLFYIAGYIYKLEVNDVDLSVLNGKTLTNVSGFAKFKNCRLPASLTIYTGTNWLGARYQIENCASDTKNYVYEDYQGAGTVTTETTIVRTGGATDGTTPVAWKLATASSAAWLFPLETKPIPYWLEQVGATITANIFGIWDGASVPYNDEIWIELEYLGSSSYPLGSWASSNKSNFLTTHTAIPADSTSTWGGSTTKFKMSVTFTPQMKGLVGIVVKAAKPSSIFYIDPEIRWS